MADNTKGKLQRENQNLRNQLKAANQEIDTIRSSRTYRAVRLAGHAKNQLRQSPVGFGKKAVKKIISKASVSHVGNNLVGVDDLQTQYEQWMGFNEPDAVELDFQRQQETAFKKRPLISILTPVFNPPEDVFRELIESVLEQTYTNFELCLGNFGDDSKIKDVIEEYARKDGRVKNYTFTENKGIAENSNQILTKVEGEYIALLDHDDTLSPNALYENVKLLNQKEYDFIYSDKDKIDESGKRFDPFFKPDWSPEIMLNANYLTHLNVMKTSVVKKVGGWDPKTDGAQDWDLFLKVVGASKHIGHISKVLYHWRVIATSTALSIETKPYALEGQRNAIDMYLKKHNIAAKSYHSGAELLLEWEKMEAGVDVLVVATSAYHLRQFLGAVPKSTAKLVVFHSFALPDGISNEEVVFRAYDEGNLSTAINRYLKNTEPSQKLLLASDLLKPDYIQNSLDQLFGWLNVPGVVAVSPRIKGNDGRVLDCGALITGEGVKPIFKGSVSYHQAAIGNIEWVRNLRVSSAYVLATEKTQFISALKRLSLQDTDMDEGALIAALGLSLSLEGRLVLDPKINVSSFEKVHLDATSKYEEISTLPALLGVQNDPYMNSNLSAEDPMRLITIGQAYDLENKGGQLPSTYNIEAMAHALARDLSVDDIQKNQQLLKNIHTKSLNKLDSIMFILPGFNAIYAGLNNIFSYADFLHTQKIKIHIAVLASEKDIPAIKQTLAEKFPALGKAANVIAVDVNTIDSLPETDMAVCTQWATAYCLVKYNKTKRKCYFIQDKEASFYAKGTISALAENTYKFGFYALANTPGLLEWYKESYGGDGVVIKSTLNLTGYAPAEKRKPTKPYKVFFYGRPNEPRNAFELGSAALVKLKQKYKSDIEIYTAGAEWDPEDYELDKTLVNLGKIAYDNLPGFYRSMDAGMMMMFSGHPGVVASELMASGCPVVVNEYDDKTWNELYEHEKDCLVAYPTATAIMDSLDRLLQDQALRDKLTHNALTKVHNFYGDYEAACLNSVSVLKSRIS